jgi:hypothetical protein
MMRRGLLLIAVALAGLIGLAPPARAKSPLKFEISWDKPMDGHVVLVIADNNRQEPRQQISEGLGTCRPCSTSTRRSIAPTATW